MTYCQIKQRLKAKLRSYCTEDTYLMYRRTVPDIPNRVFLLYRLNVPEVPILTLLVFMEFLMYQIIRIVLEVPNYQIGFASMYF